MKCGTDSCVGGTHHAVTSPGAPHVHPNRPECQQHSVISSPFLLIQLQSVPLSSNFHPGKPCHHSSNLSTLTFHPSQYKSLGRRGGCKPIVPLAPREWKGRKLFHMHLLWISLLAYCCGASLLDSFGSCTYMGITWLFISEVSLTGGVEGELLKRQSSPRKNGKLSQMGMLSSSPPISENIAFPSCEVCEKYIVNCLLYFTVGTFCCCLSSTIWCCCQLKQLKCQQIILNGEIVEMHHCSRKLKSSLFIPATM